MLVVNLFGSPGAGKSTAAAYIFSMLKMKGVSCELVTEYAKDKVWEESKEVFKDQLYILGKQHFKINRCYKKVDCVITDSPLLLSALYNQNIQSPIFSYFVYDCFNEFNNVNYFIHREYPYDPVGRFQTENESLELENKLINMLTKYNIQYKNIQGNKKSYDFIVDEIYLQNLMKMK